MKHSLLLAAITLWISGGIPPLRAQSPAAGRLASEWNITGHIPLGRVIVQSHRGAGVLAEENTVAAFELGWKLGTYPESDLRTTSDGVIVTFHDENFSRVVKGVSPELAKKGVKDLTFDELQKLDVGAWKGEQFLGRRVSRLTDAFAVMQGKAERHLYLDIKNVDFSRLAEEVRRHGVAKQIVLASPSPKVISDWKARVPESDTLLWMRGSEAQLRKRIEDLKQTGFAGITQLQIHVFPNKTIDEALAIAAIPANRIEVSVESARVSEEPFTLSRAFIIELGRELRGRGILFQALPYTSDFTVYGKLLDLGLMSFATDYPDVTMRELQRYYAAKKGLK